jgi:hypothetical protein
MTTNRDGGGRSDNRPDPTRGVIVAGTSASAISISPA